MLSKSIIDKQVNKLASEFYAGLYNGNNDDKNRALSRAYTHLIMRNMLELDDEEVVDAVVDGANDFAIDGIYFTEPQNDFFDIYIYQIKYSSRLDKKFGIKENDIIKMIDTIGNFFSLQRYDVNNKLHQKLVDINSYIEDFNIPNFHIYLCNNGEKWSDNSQKRIDEFLGQSSENKKRFNFNYINHDDIFSLFEKNKPVNSFLNFTGNIVDEAINFKRSFVGKVSVADIHTLMQEHGNHLLKQNVRDFLGFNKSVNKAIKSTLLDNDKKDDFFFLNNGITMVCEKIDYANGTNIVRAKLTNVQVINGGQTSKTIQKVVEENPEINFADTYVLVRVYQIDMSKENEFVNAITTATNSQNAIYIKDLKANDVIQKKIENGLKQYDVDYLRRRDSRRARPQDIRMDMVAEVLLSCILQKPADAKYRKSLHFSEEFYNDIFNDKINVETIYFTTMLFKSIETKRKKEYNINYPFVAFASHFILMLMYKKYINKYGNLLHTNIKQAMQWIGSDEFFIFYNEVLEQIKQAIVKISKNPTDAVDIVYSLKNKEFNNILLEK